MGCIQEKIPSGKVRYTASGFPDYQPGGGGVPRHELQLPETVEATGGNIAHIQSRGPCTPDGLDVYGHMIEIIDVVIEAVPDVVGESRRQETF